GVVFILAWGQRCHGVARPGVPITRCAHVRASYRQVAAFTLLCRALEYWATNGPGFSARHAREFLRDVGELCAEVGKRLVRCKNVGQLTRYCRLSLQSNSQHCGTFCRVRRETVDFVAQPLLRGGDLSGQYEQ